LKLDVSNSSDISKRRSNLNLDNATYEVEIRCHFDGLAEAYHFLPFLPLGLQRGCTWRTTIHGLKYFQSGQLLRTAEIVDGSGCKYFIGWKGVDTGSFANIRQELDEEIEPRVGAPSTCSHILGNLGGSPEVKDLQEAVVQLERLGYPSFMEFSGQDISGYYQPYAVHLKLMSCRQLKWPFIVEIEKTARTSAETGQCEQSLYQLSRQFKLEDRLIRDEPPTLLYKALFGSAEIAG
jgi:hypothetical protein